MRRDIPVSRLPALPAGELGLSDPEVADRKKRYGLARGIPGGVHGVPGRGRLPLGPQKALAWRGVSVENIGRFICVCSDKTGTINEGRLRLEH